MNLFIRLSLIFAFLANFSRLTAQGGNTCAIAQSSPVTIPFSANGSTCGAATDNYDDFFGTAGSCINADYGPYFTSGPDWIYYFCATQSGPMTISLTNLSGNSCADPTMPYAAPSVSVWTGCPSGGNCISGGFNNGDQASYGTTPEMGVAFVATAGQCYYVSIDADAYYCDCFTYHINIDYDPVTGVVQPSCTNMGFDDGTFNGWSGTYSNSVGPGPTGASTPNYVPIHSGFAQQHTITTGGTDPICGFPRVCPGFGPNSIMLGDGSTAGYGGSTLEQTFQVTAANAYLNYRYAVVIQDAGHPTEQQPFFKIEVFDCSGNPIQCGQYLVVGGPGIPGFVSAGSSIYYKTWTPVFIDLTPYIGTCATVRFTVGDCSQGGHFAYVYLDADCDPMAIAGPTHVCLGASTTLTAPGGAAAYSWAAPASASTQSVTVSPTTNTNYSCTVTSVAGPTCTTTLTYSVTIDPVAVASATSTEVCKGSPGTITTTVTPTGGTYSWTSGGGTGATCVASPTVTTTYTCTYTNPTGCTDTAVAQIIVDPIPTVSVPPNASYCVGATVPAGTLTPTPAAATVAWTNSNPAIGLAASGTGTSVPSFTSLASGTAVITVTPTGTAPTNCPGTPSSYTITINPLPNITVTSPTICAAGTATITASNGTSYTWSAGATSTGGNGASATATPASQTSYTVTGTDGNGCVNTAVSTVSITPLPVLTTVSDSICPGETATISAMGATSYTWSAGATSTGGNGASATASPAATTTYTVTGTEQGCSSTATATVSLAGVLVITVNSPTICNGQTANLSATGAITSYSWSAGATSSGFNTATAAPTSTTNYTVTGTSGGCTGTTTATVTVNQLPTVTVPPNAPYCHGNTVPGTNFTSNLVGTTYTWTNSNNTIGLASSGSGDIASFIASNTGTSPVTAVITVTPTSAAPANCEGPPSSYTLTINPNPVSDAGTDVAICSGTPASIGVASSAGMNYSWAPSTGLSSSTSSNPNITTVNSGSTAITTDYTVTTTNGTTSCSTTDVVSVTVNALPVLVTNDPSAVCSPNTVDLTAGPVTAGSSGAPGTLSYWQNAAATIPLNSVTSIGASGTYYIKILTAESCTDLDSVLVTINPLPVSDAGSDLLLCTGSSGTIGAAAIAGNSYLWSPTTGLSGSTVSNPTVTLVNSSNAAITTNYTVTTTTNQGCSSTDVVAVTVNIVPTANAGSSQTVCAGKTVTLAGAIGGSASGGTWSGGAGTYDPNSMALNAVYTPSAAEYAAGTVTLTLTTDDPAGPCTFASSQVTLNFYPLPVVNFAASDSSGCPVHCTTFTDSSTVSSGSIVSWQWIYGDGTPNSTVQNPSHCYDLTGYYDVTLEVGTDKGCTNQLTIPHVVHVYAVPVANFTSSPTDASVFDSEITLTNASSSDVVSWTYYFGDGDSISPSTPSPIHMYPNEQPDTYTASLFVVNKDGCTDYIEHPIVIQPEFVFYIPNAFSPNEDGINDYFFGTGIGIVTYDIYIFDRWGSMIFHGNGIDTSAWNGHANGGAKVAQQDVYIWKVKLSDIFGKHHEYVGTVTIVR